MFFVLYSNSLKLSINFFIIFLNYFCVCPKWFGYQTLINCCCFFSFLFVHLCFLKLLCFLGLIYCLVMNFNWMIETEHFLHSLVSFDVKFIFWWIESSKTAWKNVNAKHRNNQFISLCKYVPWYCSSFESVRSNWFLSFAYVFTVCEWEMRVQSHSIFIFKLHIT